MMKRLFTILFVLMPFYALAQVDFDKYVPQEYYPKHYLPKSTGAPLEILPYQEKRVSPSIKNLKLLIDRTENSPEIREKLIVDWIYYNDLYYKTKANGKSESLGKKKNMKHFQEDWTTVDRYYYEKECESKKRTKENRIRDSISFRNSFVEDSLQTRISFVKDSIQGRITFVEDSLYRADYRKKGNYDYVVFDGPHGNPVLCYKKGKAYDGKSFNNYGLVEKEYKAGVLIHDYSYDDNYLVAIGKEKGKVKALPKVYDAIEKVNYVYTYDGSAVLDKDYYDSKGVLFKEISYSDDRPFSVTSFTYFPDNKTIKQRIVQYYDALADSIDYVVTEYYSDKTEKQRKEFMTLSNGKRVLRKVVIKKDGYEIIEYYGFDGEFERRETKVDVYPYLYN